MEAKMRRYGHPADHAAAGLALASTVTFAFAWPAANVVLGGVAATGMLGAVAITLIRRLRPSAAHLSEAVAAGLHFHRKG